MKKILSLFLAVTILLSMAVPAMAAEDVILEEEMFVEIPSDDTVVFEERANTSAAPAADQAATSGKCGTNMYWSFHADSGILTISGTGSMDPIVNKWEDFAKAEFIYEPAWWSLPVRQVIVEEGVEYLADYAFAQSAKGNEALLKTVQLPTTLKAIPKYGFIVSTAMTSLKIPEGIKSITGWPFGEPDVSFLTLTELYLPSTLESIDFMTVLFAGVKAATMERTLQTIRFAGTKAQWSNVQRVDRTAPMGGIANVPENIYAQYEQTFDNLSVSCTDDNVFDFDDLLFAKDVTDIEATDVSYYDGEGPKYPTITIYYADGTNGPVPDGIPVVYPTMPTKAGTCVQHSTR